MPKGCRGSRAAWKTDNGELMASLNIAHLSPDGGLPLPAQAKLILEIGANSRNTVDKDFLPAHPEAFVLTFEPILDKWATLLSRNSKPVRCEGHRAAIDNPARLPAMSFIRTP